MLPIARSCMAARQKGNEMTFKQRLGSSTAIAVGLVLLGNGVAAQEQAILLDTVILGYAEDGTPITAGTNTTGLDDEDLTAQGGTISTDDVLRTQTSVYTQHNPSNPGVAVNIRGFEGSGRVSAMVDGVPQNFRSTGHSAQGYTYIDENLLAGIDITRGATTTAGGSGIAGSVNFRTISARDVVDGEGMGGLLRFSYGTNKANTSAMMAAAYADDTAEALVAFSHHDSDDFEDGDGNTRNFTAKDNWSGLVKLGYRIDDRQKISFSAMQYNGTFVANSYAQDVSSDTYTFGYDFDAGNGLVNLDLNFYLAEIENEYLAYVGTSPFGGGSVGRNMKTRTTGFNATNISEFAPGMWNVVSINGVEYSRDRLSGSNAGVNPANGEARRAALFSENIFTNGPWEITAGLRYSSYTLDGTTSNGPIDLGYDSVDPKLTVAYWATDWIQPYATISRASRAPTLQETMLGGTHPGGGTTGMVANPELQPEESTGYELGFNIERSNLLREGDRLSGRVNYYRMDVENYVIATFGFTNAFGATGAAFVNVPGTSQTSGLEVELDYETGGVELGLSYTKNDSKLPSQLAGLGTGQYLPDNTWSLRAARHFLDGTLTIGGQYSYTSGGLYSTLYSGSAVQRDSSYELVDLFATYDVTETFSVYAKVSNLFDKTYVPWLSDDQNGPGRSIYIGGEARF